MDKETAEIIKVGKDFELLISQEGWKAFNKILNSIQEERLLELIDYNGTDANVMKHKQMAVRCIREFRKEIFLIIEESIEAARQAILNARSEE